MKTPVTYYGGKQMLVPWILPLIPAHTVYTEPFFGGGAVYFAKPPSANETINDINGHVVNFYRCLQMNFEELKKHIDASLISRDQHTQAMKILQEEDPDPTERAWAWWYRVNFSFASKIDGGMRYSNEQHTCVPNMLANKKDEFTRYLQKRIEKTTIENRDALWVIQTRNIEKAFHYLDPPYMNADQGHYSGYTEDQFEELLQTIEGIHGKFLLSNYPSDILDHYTEKNGWKTQTISMRLTAKPGANHKKDELLVFNYNKNQHQKSLF